MILTVANGSGGLWRNSLNSLGAYAPFPLVVPRRTINVEGSLLHIQGWVPGKERIEQGLRRESYNAHIPGPVSVAVPLLSSLQLWEKRRGGHEQGQHGHGSS